LIATYLRLHELLQASLLSRSLHTLFNSEAVWRGRLKEVEALQCVPFEEDEPTWVASHQPATGEVVDRRATPPTYAVLSYAQLASPPFLPSFSAVATLCLWAFIQAEEQQRQGQARSSWQSHFYQPRTARLTAILHLPSTLVYHARIITPEYDSATYTCVAHRAPTSSSS
jgi:hypothetical protein